MRCAFPRHFHGQQVGRMEGLYIRLAFVDFAQAWQAGKEEALLSARVSGMPRAPFMRAMACNTCCRRYARIRSDSSASNRLRAAREVRTAMVRLSWQDFSELEIS